MIVTNINNVVEKHACPSLLPREEKYVGRSSDRSCTVRSKPQGSSINHLSVCEVPPVLPQPRRRYAAQEPLRYLCRNAICTIILISAFSCCYFLRIFFLFMLLLDVINFILRLRKLKFILLRINHRSHY